MGTGLPAARDKKPPEALDSVDLGRARTRMAADRTLMAWMRTAVSLFGFGFTIFKFFQYLRESGVIGEHFRPREPRLLGMALIVLGLGFLLLGLLEYGRFLRRLGQRAREGWPTLTAAVLLWCLGLATLVTLFFRLG